MKQVVECRIWQEGKWFNWNVTWDHKRPDGRRSHSAGWEDSFDKALESIARVKNPHLQKKGSGDR
jgi:hypothetical protein